MPKIFTILNDTPVGNILIEDNGSSVTRIVFLKNEIFKNEIITPSEIGMKAASQLCEYFSGKRKIFELPVDPAGSEFQNSVWEQLKKIPYGEVRSYGDIAEAIGNSKASRAVGGANNKNPIPIVIPCHRVIGRNGKLVGYSGGLEIKRFLLEHESANS